MTNRQYLDPKKPLDIEPDADRNVERITDCCLDVRPKSSYIFGRGRGGGAWWMIWMGMMLIVLGAFTSFYDGNIETGIPAFLGITAIAVIGFGLSLLWPIHIWKTHLPLRFNRQTRKVYFHWKGKTYVEDWDKLGAYIKVQRGVNAMGTPLIEPQINFDFFDEEGNLELTIFVMGTERIGLTSDQKATVFWEYIRRYMEDGLEHLPEPNVSHGFKQADLSELRKQYTLLPLWQPGASILTKSFNIALLPFYLTWDTITYPTEILYYFLEKHVKTNPFPPEMEEACQCTENVKVWYPKQPSEKAA
jgi:hypothetical protein